MASASERRKFIRIKKSNALKHVKFQLSGGAGDALQSLSKDLSAGGILFESAVLYAIGDILRLEINVPGWEKFKPEFYKPGLTKSEPLIVLVKVMRVERVGAGKHDIGCMFVGIDDGHQMALAKYLKQQSS
jgi:hypothetical protein